MKSWHKAFWFFCNRSRLRRLHGDVFMWMSANPIPVAPYTNWPTAAMDIQSAIDVATSGDLILVTNGVYNTGGQMVYGSLTNLVVINKAVTVQSMNGPAVTLIKGIRCIGDNAVRCIYIPAIPY